MAPLLVSDQEREYTVGLLRDHLASGRLTVEEFEDRVDEAWRARFADDLWQALRWLPVEAPPPPPRSTGRDNGRAALILALTGLALFVVTFGFGSLLALPLFVLAWARGHKARRSASQDGRGIALAGELIGLTGTLVCLLVVGSVAAVFFAVLA